MHKPVLQTIPVDKIKGSVYRQEFKHGFSLEHADNEKLFSIEEARNQEMSLPPISVYQIKDNYYVIDGNHRVLAALKNKQVYIDAEVIEIPDNDSSEHHLVEKIKFVQESGLNKIEFTEIASYQRLIDYIQFWDWKILKKQLNFGIKKNIIHY